MTKINRLIKFRPVPVPREIYPSPEGIKSKQPEVWVAMNSFLQDYPHAELEKLYMGHYIIGVNPTSHLYGYINADQEGIDILQQIGKQVPEGMDPYWTIR